jgi:hypothetical protein
MHQPQLYLRANQGQFRELEQWPLVCQFFLDGLGRIKRSRSCKWKIYLTVNQRHSLKQVSGKEQLRAQLNSRRQNYHPIRFFGQRRAQ